VGCGYSRIREALVPFGDYGAYIKYLEAAARAPHVCTCSRCEALHLLSPTSEIGPPDSKASMDLARPDEGAMQPDSSELQQREARQKPAGGATAVERELLLFVNRVLCYAAGDDCVCNNHVTDLNEEIRTTATRILDSAVPNPEEPIYIEHICNLPDCKQCNP
jgi:hypothetical protein